MEEVRRIIGGAPTTGRILGRARLRSVDQPFSPRDPLRMRVLLALQ